MADNLLHDIIYSRSDFAPTDSPQLMPDLRQPSAIVQHSPSRVEGSLAYIGPSGRQNSGSFDVAFNTGDIYPRISKSAVKGDETESTFSRKRKKSPVEDDGGKDRPVDAAVRREVIENLGARAKDSYIFPEKGDQIDRMLHDRLQRGEYDGITSAKALAVKLTSDIQGLTGDKHFKVDYSENRPFDDALGEKPPPELEKKFHDEADKRRFDVKEPKLLYLDKDHKIGYLRLDGFANPKDAAKYINEAMKTLSSAQALIIDLRHNRGGDPHTVKLIADTLLPPGTHINDIVWRKGNRMETEEFRTEEPPPGTRFSPEKPVYVLTSNQTFSGGEELANDLKMQGRATVIGQSTGGGANPGRNHRIQEHFSVFVPDGRAVNPIDQGNWEGRGVAPQVYVPPSEDSQLIAIKMAKSRLGLK